MNGPTIGVIGAGAMGSGVARRLREQGARVISPLEGRSEATLARAASVGMKPVPMSALGQARLVLSIVPPAQALAVAQHYARDVPETTAIFVDCNALDVRSVQQIAAIVEPRPFADAGIIGLPPSEQAGPFFHVSGARAPDVVEIFGQLGFEASAMAGPVGAASALKMSYAGITKGLTALAALMVLAADRVGAGPALRAELARSQPQLLSRFEKSLPDMLPKAYRWVAEMQEIAAFVGEGPGSAVYQAFAASYAHLADGNLAAADIEVLRAFAQGNSVP